MYKMITLKQHLKKAMILGVSLLGFQGVQAQLSGNYTIDANTKTGGTNYASFKDFESDLYNNGVSGAVTVQVVPKSGPYTEQVNFRLPNSKNVPNAKMPVVIYGNGNTITFNGTSSSFHTVSLNAIDYLTLSNLNIIASNATYAWGIWFSNSANYNTIDSCRITCPNNTTTGTNAIGIVFSASGTSYSSGGIHGQYNQIKNNLIRGNTTGGFYFGISYYGSSYSNASANIFTNNEIQDFYVYGTYMYYTNSDQWIGNKISRPNKTSLTTGYGMMIQQFADVKVLENRVFDMYRTNPSYGATCYGLYIVNNYGNNKTSINNNVVYNNTTGSGTFYGIYANYMYYGTLDILHNTILFEGNPNVTSNYSYLYGIYFIGHTVNSGGLTRVLNNVVDLRMTNAQPGTIVGFGYGANNVQSANTSYLQCNNNIVNLSTPATFSGTKAIAYEGYNFGRYYNTMQDWRTFGYGQNDVEIAPKYLDKANGNLGMASIGADNKGINVGVTTDILGKTRHSTTPDAGAFELDIDLKVTSVSIPNATFCQFKTQAVTIQIKNSSAFALENPNVEYRIGAAGVPVIETYNGTIAANATVNYTFTKLLEMPAGAQTLYGYIQTRFNENSSFAITGKLAPTGSDFVKGSGFIGTFNSGNPGDPDVVANPDKLIYELKNPTGYANNRYGTDWVISKLDFTELVGGAGVPSSDTATKNPGITAGTLTFTPSQAITDKTYKVAYTVYSFTTGCDAPVISREILVAPRPVMGFDVAPACGGSKSKFVGKSSVTSGTYSVMWYFGDGSTSDYVNPEHLYGASGNYQVKLVATSDRGYKDSITKTVGVYNNPVANFTYTNTCDNNPASFVATSTSPNAGAIVNAFDFGDGNSATGNNVTHTFGNFGEFPVTLTTTDAVGCVTKVTKNFTHSEKPNASFTINNGSLICSNSTSDFTNTSTNASGVGYEWDFGDGTTAVTSNTTHKFLTDGSFTVKLIARNDAGCIEETTKNITVQKGADIQFGYGGNCNGQLVSFTNTTVDPAGTSYSWNFGDGSTSSDRVAVHQYGSTGEFTVEVTASTGAGCISTADQKIIVGEKPVAFFSTSKENACTGDNISINNGSYASTGNLTYAWDLGNGDNSTDMAPSVTYTNAGDFKIVLITNAGACSDTATQTVSVTATPDAGFGFTSEGLGLGGIVFAPTVDAGSGNYVWTLGDGTIKKDKSAFTYRYAPTGYFRACLERNDNGCVSIVCQDISINAASVTKATENGLNVYPNPTKGTFTLMPVNGNIGMSTVSVVNTVGQTILNVNVDLTNGYNMNLDNVAPGIYTVNVIAGNTQYNQKVTIVK